MAIKLSKIIVDKETFYKKIDFKKYYKSMEIYWLNKDGSKVKGKIVMIRRKSPNELRVGKQIFRGEIDLNEYVRKLIIQELEKENRNV